jgi:hypothetical protein
MLAQGWAPWSWLNPQVPRTPWLGARVGEAPDEYLAASTPS